VPFLLDGVAGVEALNQPDGIHPSAEGAQVVAENVWKVLEPLLKRAAARIDVRSIPPELRRTPWQGIRPPPDPHR
jgi:hypothetical protein